MSPDYSSVNALHDKVSQIASATSPSDVFKALLDGSRLAAPRAALFLVRQGRIKGLGGRGYDPDTGQRLRAFTAGGDEGWLGALAGKDRTVLEQRRGSAADPDFGQSPASESAATAVRVKGRAIALVLLERSGNEVPWAPPFLALMVQVAQLRLELNLAQRRAPAGTTAVAAGKPEAVRAAVAAAPAPAPLEAPPAAETTGLSPVPAPAGTATAVEDPALDAARRFARLVATDIRLYNEEAVLLGRRNGDLGERLSEHLMRGRETFLRRYGDLGPTALEILHKAYTQVLAGGDEALLPASLLE